MEEEKHDEVELDLSFTDVEDKPPEFCRYRDEGCDLADSCLNCPFVQCIYDEPGGKQRWLKRLRAREIVRLFTTEGKGIKELAVIFGVSQRTVQRDLKMVTDCYAGAKRSISGRSGEKTKRHPHPKILHRPSGARYGRTPPE